MRHLTCMSVLCFLGFVISSLSLSYSQETDSESDSKSPGAVLTTFGMLYDRNAFLFLLLKVLKGKKIPFSFSVLYERERKRESVKRESVKGERKREREGEFPSPPPKKALLYHFLIPIKTKDS